MPFILSLLIAYLLGSLTSAIIVSRLFQFPDPRSQGSQNAGATNVLRLGGKKAALIVLIADALKGLIALGIAHLGFGVDGALLGFVGFAAVLGHVFPIFFKFRGGKGVATAAGVVFGLSFWVAVLLLLIWAILAALTRYVSLASSITAIALPVVMALSPEHVFAFPMFLITLLILWKHRNNFDRLKHGTEPKLKWPPASE